MALSGKRPSGNKHPNRGKVKKILDDSGVRRLNVPIDAATYRVIKMRAAMEDQSISEITRRLWIEYLDR